jgi:plastocyanin
MKRCAITLVLCQILMMGLPLGLAACGATHGTGPNDVHMDGDSFVQKSVTIKRGESITLIADTFVPHIIVNGSEAHPQQEPGAPEVKNLRIDGNSLATIGPFDETGTFVFHCTLHAGMELTVSVREPSA